MSDLPPLDQSQAYVVVGPNDQRGPYTMELLVSEVLAGRLSEATPVWWPGLEDWTTMGGHPGVAAELERRRAASAPAAPVWADPSHQPSQPGPDQYAQPAADPYAQPASGQYAQPAAEQYAQPAAEQYAQPAAEQYAQPAAESAAQSAQAAAGTADPFGIGVAPASLAEEPGTSEVLDPGVAVGHVGQAGDDQPVDAEVIEIDEIVAVDTRHHEVSPPSSHVAPCAPDCRPGSTRSTISSARRCPPR